MAHKNASLKIAEDYTEFQTAEKHALGTTDSDTAATGISQLAANDSEHLQSTWDEDEPATTLIEHKSRILFDMLSATLLIAMLSPIMLIIAGYCRVKYGRVFDIYKKMGKNNQPFELHRFSGDVIGRNLATLFNIIVLDISWVGPSIRAFSAHPSNETDQTLRIRPGLLSIYDIRRMTGTLYEREPPPADYPNHTLVESFGIMLRWALANLVSSNRGTVKSETIDLFGVTINNVTVDEAVNNIVDHAKANQSLKLAFVNPACMNEAVENPAYKRDLDDMDTVLPDGSGLSLACRMLGVQMKANVNGTDLFPIICERAAELGQSLYFLGSQPGVAEEMANNLSVRFPDLKIAGHHHGYFDQHENDAVITEINASGADIVLVAFGVPRQERWIQQHADSINAPVLLGVGGLFDFYSGRISRSPRWLQDMGLEWIWRFLQEPGRMWKRYFIGNPKFVYRVWRQARACERKIITDRFLKFGSPLALTRMRFFGRHLTWKVVIASTHVVKRTLDIAISGMALLMLIAPLSILAIVLRAESPGPVFYSQTRVGRWGKLFTMYKFRSMYIDADQRRDALLQENEMAGGVLFKMKDDPRITRVGRFIRKYSVDELPQFWNVLIGDMSLVGPRPPIPSEVAQYTTSDRRRLEIKPGITCIWQVSGRSDIPFKEQVKLDVEYIESTSLWKDLKILLATVPAVLLGKGAY